MAYQETRRRHGDVLPADRCTLLLPNATKGFRRRSRPRFGFKTKVQNDGSHSKEPKKDVKCQVRQKEWVKYDESTSKSFMVGPPSFFGGWLESHILGDSKRAESRLKRIEIGQKAACCLVPHASGRGKWVIEKVLDEIVAGGSTPMSKSLELQEIERNPTIRSMNVLLHDTWHASSIFDSMGFSGVFSGRCVGVQKHPIEQQQSLRQVPTIGWWKIKAGQPSMHSESTTVDRWIPTVASPFSMATFHHPYSYSHQRSLLWISLHRSWQIRDVLCTQNAIWYLGQPGWDISFFSWSWTPLIRVWSFYLRPFSSFQWFRRVERWAATMTTRHAHLRWWKLKVWCIKGIDQACAAICLAKQTNSDMRWHVQVMGTFWGKKKKPFLHPNMDPWFSS